ncbi:MAG: Maf family protein [Terriglobia bacterium]
MALILASGSPRRREILERAGIEFTVRAAEIDETARPGEAAADYAKRLAREKALSVARSIAPGNLVLGADTVVVTAGHLLGKPRNDQDAARMLRLLSGGTHYVVTGICLVRAPDTVEALTHAASTVVFKPLAEAEIQSYISTGEPLDKAGAYAIQGIGSKFVARVEGTYDNIVGLPIELVKEALRSAEGRTPGGAELARRNSCQRD